MNVLMMTNNLITGGAESYFCKLENSLEHPKLNLYTAAVPGDMVRQLKRKEDYLELSRNAHLSNFLKIRKLIIEKDINLIHCNGLKMVLYAIAIMRTLRKNIKILYTKHNLTMLESKGPIFSFLLNRYVDRIIAVSEFEKNRLISTGVKQHKIEVIYNGVDLDQFEFHKKEKSLQYKIGILGRLSVEKNHAFFVKIADQLKNNPSITFYIAGDGPERENIHSMISSLNLSGNVKMLGTVHEPEKFIKDMDVLLLTSHQEVFPMVILEAMAVGTPVVAIDRGGIKESIIDGDTGYVVPDHSIEDFCSRIIHMKENKESTLAMIKKARERVQLHFSHDKMVKHTLDEYLKSLETEGLIRMTNKGDAKKEGLNEKSI
ncbi:glycosyltransferase family 4 protein [Bacillus infantis]|uniref:glycosyltransferase family 4 protein n=1 Tax=Bacillus infantis TaxID=324767 RepID=UPI003CF56F3D